MAVSFLKINVGSWIDKRKRMGTLQIHRQNYRSNISFGWEWYGGPEGIDGGPCEWVVDEFTRNGIRIRSVQIEMSSPLTNMRGAIHTYRWDKGPIPPNSPWFTGKTDFRAPNDQSLMYKSPKIGTLEMSWEIETAKK